MATREERAAQAAANTGRMKAIFAKEIAASAEGARIYQEGAGWSLTVPQGQGQTQVRVERGNVCRALMRAQGKPCVIDPASFTKPAGNYAGGAWGPEAILCASSNLYPILESLQDTYYAGNKGHFNDGLCTDRAVYVPDVQFLQDGKAKPVDVLVMAEPNRKRALENPARSEAECNTHLRYRINSALGIAAENGCQTLVATAFGCGFNGNDAAQVAGLFAQWIAEHPGVFQQVVFVVANAALQDAFLAAFPDAAQQEERKPQQQTPVDPEPQEEPDEMDGVPAPNEDGRWVF